MSKWQEVALGEVTECLDRQRVPVKESERVEGDIPYYGANGQQGWIDRPIFDEPLVLVAEDGGHFSDPARGVAYKIEGPSWVNNHAHVLRPLKQHLDIDFLRRILENYDFGRYISGSTRSKLNQKQLNSATIPLPPLEEQRRIAAILDKAEELRTKRREAIAKLDTLAQSIFIDMFGDPVTNPMGWETTTLREVASIERLTVIPKEIVTGTPYIGLEHIETGGRIIGTVRVNSGELKSSKFSFNSKHILYGKLRPYLCKIATPTVSGVCSTDILPILPGPKLTKSFLARYLRQPYWVDYATSLSVGANLPRLNPKSLEQFPVLLPNLEVQTRFSAAVDHLSQTGSRFANQLTNIDLAFSSLQQRAFKGEL